MNRCFSGMEVIFDWASSEGIALLHVSRTTRQDQSLRVFSSWCSEQKPLPKWTSIFCIPAVILWLPSNFLFCCSHIASSASSAITGCPPRPKNAACCESEIDGFQLCIMLEQAMKLKSSRKMRVIPIPQNHRVPWGCPVLLCRSWCGWRNLSVFWMSALTLHVLRYSSRWTLTWHRITLLTLLSY